MNWRSLAVSWWQRLRTRIHYARVLLWPDVVVLEGRTENGVPLSILRAGISDRQTRYFFAGQVLAELCRERELGRCWLWKLPALARAQGCAFIVFRVATLRAALAHTILGRGDHAAFHLPVFVNATVDVDNEARLLQCRDLKDDVRRIRTRGFRYSVSRSRHDLETFILNYHHPHVHGVHGFRAVEMDFQRLLASCTRDQMPERWELLKVELEGNWVAAQLLVNGEGTPALMELGVKDGDPSLVKHGAVWAIYWLSLEYLRSQGHRSASLKHTPPFLSSGVLRYKLKFTPRLTAARATDGFLLWFDKRDTTARETMLREPLLVFKGEGLGLVWFADDPAAAPDPVRIPLRRLAVAGVTDVERVVLPRGG